MNHSHDNFWVWLIIANTTHEPTIIWSVLKSDVIYLIPILLFGTGGQAPVPQIRICLLLIGIPYLPFANRSRRPVFAHAQTEHDTNLKFIFLFYICQILRNRPARVGSSLSILLANSIHQTYAHASRWSAWFRSGELARLKHGYGRLT